MMTNEEKFRAGTVLYKDNADDYVLELWGASTKHPDSVFYFSDFTKNPDLEDERQLFQWVLECASKLMFPFHSLQLANWAIDHYDSLA